MPLLTFEVDPTPAPPPPPPARSTTGPAKKPITSYILAVLVVLILLLPQPSILLLLVYHYIEALHSPWTFALHLGSIHTLTFFTFCSYIVCISRHPGPVNGPGGGSGGGTSGKNLNGRIEGGHDHGDGASDALLADAEEGQGVDERDPPPEYYMPVRWCRHCNAPKPERAHHCSICDICVLKMGMFRILSFSPLC